MSIEIFKNKSDLKKKSKLLFQGLLGTGEQNYSLPLKQWRVIGVRVTIKLAILRADSLLAFYGQLLLNGSWQLE